MAPRTHKKSARSHRSTLSLQKTEIIINVYDLLAPGRVSSLLWHLGTSLLHSGVVINGKEYAYGGHDRRGVTGVYWTKPRSEPPGGTFRCEILHGFTLATPAEIDSIIYAASQEFLGPSYNLLTKNCNHFTAFLCRKLTGRPGPTWLNRAASIGLALPCVVPREWIEPPEFDTADGELLDEEEQSRRSSLSEAYEDEDNRIAAMRHDERSRMLTGGGGRGGRDSGGGGRGSRDNGRGGGGGGGGRAARNNSDDHTVRSSTPLSHSSQHQVHLVGDGADSSADSASTSTSNNSNTRAAAAASANYEAGGELINWDTDDEQQRQQQQLPQQPSRRSISDSMARGKGKGRSKAGGLLRDAAGHALPPSERVPTL